MHVPSRTLKPPQKINLHYNNNYFENKKLKQIKKSVCACYTLLFIIFLNNAPNL